MKKKGLPLIVMVVTVTIGQSNAQEDVLSVDGDETIIKVRM